MKVFKNKILPIMLCAIMLSTQIIFGCLTVRAHADENVVQWFTDNFSDAVSAIGGAIWDSTTECWNAWKRILGLDTDEEVEQYINDNVFLTGHTGGGYDVRFTTQFVDDMQNFVDEYKGDFENYVYGYTTDIRRYVNFFTNRSQYQAVVNLVREHGLMFLTAYDTYSFKNTTGNGKIGFVEGGNQCLMLSETSSAGVYCFVTGYTSTDLTNGVLVNCKPYKQSWEDFSPYTGNWKTYAFMNNSDTSLSDITSLEWSYPSYTKRPYDNTNYLYTRDWSTVTGNIGPYYDRSVPVTYGIKEYIVFRSADYMRSYSVGNLPYYQVPQNPNLTYTNGSYNITSTQLDNSISYGNVTSYVDSNNVSSYETVINYINNYYGSGGGSGSGGSGSGDSGSDIDWGWLGRIGEVIGGLISALGNIVAGIIDAISELITSVTEGIPNVFGQLMEWLFPFLPDYLISLLSLTIMAVVIVSLVKLLRGK